MNKQEVLEKLSKYTGISTSSQLEEFSEDAEFLVYGKRMIGEEALLSAAAWSGVPKRFLADCPVELQVAILNHFFREYEAPKIVYKDYDALAFVDQRSYLLDSERVVETIEHKFDIDRFDRMYMSNGGVELYIIGEAEQAVVVGDVVKGGAYINFSPYGEYSPEVVGYTYRLACLNGALRTDQLVRYSYRGNEDPYDWLANSVEVAYNSANAEVERYKQMREMKLDGNTATVLKHLLRGVPKVLHEYITDEMLNRKPETVYDLMCIITEIASHKIENPRHVFDIMSIGGEISEHIEICPTCRQLVES